MTDAPETTDPTGTRVTYCANGCTRKSGEGRIPVTTTPPSLLCSRCEDDLRLWLREIPERYALLPNFRDPSTQPREPDKRASKQTNPPALLRLDVLDLLDTRLGRHWSGTAAAEDRRGTIGVLDVTARRIATERPVTYTASIDVVTAAKFITRHLLWLVEQPWVTITHEELKHLHRDLGDAVGIRRPKPVGACFVVAEGAEEECGGPLLPSRGGGVHCPRCRASWDVDQLRILGRNLGEPA